MLRQAWLANASALGNTGDNPEMTRPALTSQAVEAFRHDLQPGERIAASSAVTSDPSRWGVAVMLMLAVAVTVVSVVSLLGTLPADPVEAMILPVLGLGAYWLPRPMYMVVTDRRLICGRMSRLRSIPRERALAAPLADVCILNYRSGNRAASIRFQVACRRPIKAYVGRNSRRDFTDVETALARSGAFAKLDPPYPSAESLPTAAHCS